MTSNIRLITLLILSVFFSSCNDDRRDGVLQEHKESDVIKPYLNQARELMVNSDFDLAINKLKVADSLANSLSDPYSKSTVLSHLAWIAEKNELLDSASRCYERAIAINRTLGDTASLISDLNAISIVYRELTQFSRSAEILEEAVDITLIRRDSSALASVANRLGNVFIELLDYEKAFENYKLAATVWENDEKKKSSYSIAVHNQGDALRGMGQLEEALATYKKALKLKRDLNRTSSSAYTLTGMGRTYLLMDSVDRADAVLKEALEIRSKSSNKNSYAETLLILSRVSTARGRYREAERRLKEVEQIARTNNKADLLRDAFEDQRTLYKQWNRLADLARVDELYDIMTDSLYREEKLKVQEAQAAANLQREQQRTQLAQQDADLAQLEADAESQKAQFRLILVVLALMGLAVIAWQLLQIRKRNASLIALNSRIKLITDNAFHSQKNALGLISALLRSKARQTAHQKELEVLKDVEGKIEALGGVAKSLFQRRIEDNTAVAARVHLKNYLEELVDDTFSSVASSADLDMEIEDIETTSTEALNVGLITNEAVTNFSKYAESQGAETLMIRVLKKAETLWLSFTDDGPGFPEGFDFSSSGGFGMQMMANLVDDMDGSLSLKREDDLTLIEIHIPLKT